MTILVAVKKDGRVFLGADRITTFGNEYHTDLVGGQKIIKLRNAYLATSGYTLLDNVIEHLVQTGHKMMDNPFRNRGDVFTFFLELYGELRKAYTLVDSGKDTYAGIYNVFLVVTPTNIYGISNNLSVSEYPLYAAKGAGSDYALGCLYGLHESISDGYELVRLSLEAACHFSVYCREPLDIIEVSEKDFKGPQKGYKALGKSLRTLPKRKTPGNLATVISGTRTSGKASKNGASGGASANKARKNGAAASTSTRKAKPAASAQSTARARSASTTKNGKSVAKRKSK